MDTTNTIDIPSFLQASAPMIAGHLISVRAEDKGGDCSYVTGQMMRFPDGRIGGMTVSDACGLTDFEQYHLTTLITRCCQGSWHLSGLRNATRADTYAHALVLDAIAAERAA